MCLNTLNFKLHDQSPKKKKLMLVVQKKKKKKNCRHSV